MQAASLSQHPAAVSSSTCRSGFCSLVETRAQPSRCAIAPNGTTNVLSARSCDLGSRPPLRPPPARHAAGRPRVPVQPAPPPGLAHSPRNDHHQSPQPVARRVPPPGAAPHDHPQGSRSRVQGFPDCYGFVGRVEDRASRIGIAVPPPLAEAIGTEIAACLAGRPGSDRLEEPFRRRTVPVARQARQAPVREAGGGAQRQCGHPRAAPEWPTEVRATARAGAAKRWRTRATD